MAYLALRVATVMTVVANAPTEARSYDACSDTRLSMLLRHEKRRMSPYLSPLIFPLIFPSQVGSKWLY